LRLHFAGRFQAAVSTVNNDPAHFDNATFQPAYQQRAIGTEDGWWNPRGEGDWRLFGCAVTSAWMADGTPARGDDPVLQALIADSDRAAPAKLVDLDPDQQMVSTIWGLEMRVCSPDGSTLVRGQFEPAAFFDIWLRAAGGPPGDMRMGAMYQSLLTGVEWSEADVSPFLAQLRNEQRGDLLSVKFSVDGYNMDWGAGNFATGRIVGTLGPATPDEPAHLVRGRQFISSQPGPMQLAGPLNSCTAALDPATAKLYLDLGNALPTDTPGGATLDLGELSLRTGSGPLCAVPYGGSGWYERTAGVVALPADRPFSTAELDLISKSPLSLWIDRKTTAAIEELPAFVRPDQFVFRLSPGEKITARLYATKLGSPYDHATVLLTRDQSSGDPPNAIDFPDQVVTNADGVAELSISGRDPGNPRGYIDGQIYGIRPALAAPDGDGNPVINPWNFISLLLWNAFVPDSPITWYGSLQPIFDQYANLYPVMQGFLDLSSYDSVVENKDLLLLAFGLEVTDPNSMPVTRDLSPAKRTAIIAWLKHAGPDGKPLMGAQPPSGGPPAATVAQPEPAAPSEPPAPSEPATEPGEHPLGGKTAAIARQMRNRANKG
jgi:hypothetical protein